eukprot:scpid51001/ scgid29480/ 
MHVYGTTHPGMKCVVAYQLKVDSLCNENHLANASRFPAEMRNSASIKPARRMRLVFNAPRQHCTRMCVFGNGQSCENLNTEKERRICLKGEKKGRERERES